MTTIQGFKIDKDKKISENFSPYAIEAAKKFGFVPISKDEKKVESPVVEKKSVVDKIVAAVTPKKKSSKK